MAGLQPSNHPLMASKSRYSRTIESSKAIARAAAIVRDMHRELPSARGADVSILTHLRAASTTLEAVVEECNLARGMYLNAPTIRNTIVGAGQYLQERQPKLAEMLTAAQDAKDHPEVITLWASFAEQLTELAVSIAHVSFDPSTTPSIT